MPRIALGIEYDGAGYCGWQTQPSGRAVQDAVDAALSAIAAEAITTQCAGRTDAGVHALGQVIHFDTQSARPLSAWVRGVNGRLPRDVAVQWAREVPAAFHARNSARGRAYTYLLLNRPERPGLNHHRVGWHHRPLDLAAMARAASHLLGTHDFTSFRAAECQARSPVKHLQVADMTRQGELIALRFAADAFLHHMVRNIVGCLVMVGKGARAPDWILEVLQARDRRVAAPTFAAAGLYLTAVKYDASWGLPGGDAGFPPALSIPAFN